MTPSAAAATRSVSVDKAGVGAAVLNASRQIGGSLGIALIGAIIAFEAGDGVRTPEAFVDGLQTALLVASGHRRSRRDRGVLARASPRSRAPRRSGAPRSRPRDGDSERAPSRRGTAPRSSSTLLCASSPREAMPARPPRRSRAKPASRSRSSIGTSPPSESSTSRAWTPRGSESACVSRSGSASSGRSRGGRRSARRRCAR